MKNKEIEKEKGKHNFDVITKTNDNKLLVRCKHCGTTMTMSRTSYYGNPKCINRDCVNARYGSKRSESLIGKTIGDFVCIDDKGGKITLECQLCHTKIERERRAINNSTLICGNPKCENRFRKSKPLIGVVYGHFKCIKDLPYQKVKVECDCCHTATEVSKRRFEEAEKDTEKKLCSNLSCKQFDLKTPQKEINRQIDEDDTCLGRLGIKKIKTISLGDSTQYILSTETEIINIGFRELKKLLKTQDVNSIK